VPLPSSFRYTKQKNRLRYEAGPRNPGTPPQIKPKEQIVALEKTVKAKKKSPVKAISKAGPAFETQFEVVINNYYGWAKRKMSHRP